MPVARLMYCEQDGRRHSTFVRVSDGIITEAPRSHRSWVGRVMWDVVRELEKRYGESVSVTTAPPDAPDVEEK